MSDGIRIPHHQGLRSAEAALDLLAGTFERAAVAGSLRRGSNTIGDLDLVLRPSFADGVNLLDRRIADLRRDGVFALAKRADGAIKSNGPRRKCVVFQGLTVELRLVLPDRHWGPAMVIYTGPYDANMVLVTESGKFNREKQRGVLPVGLRFDDGGLWDGATLLTTLEEEHVFHVCGLPFIPPNERSAEAYQRLASGEKYKHVIALAKWPALVDAVHTPDDRIADVRMPAGVPSGGRVEQMGMF